MKIQIRDYIGKDIKVLRDRPKGKQVREQTKLDAKDIDSEKYEIVFDDDFISINSSFFLGMFEESIQKLGEEKFREKYSFKCKEALKDKIEACIITALVAGTSYDC